MRTIKYLLKRIIIGVGVALVIMLIKGNLFIGVSAKSITSYKAPFESYTFNNTQATFTTTIDNPFFKNVGVGYLHFNFAIVKSSGNATAPVSIVRNVVVFSGSTGYVCDIGSSSLQNSTYGGVSYSANCPVNIGSSGITSINYYPSDLQSNDLSIYRWTNEGYYSFESDSSVNVNVDTSSTTNAINNQTNTITNNVDNNTQSIIDNQKELLGDRCENIANVSSLSNGLWASGTNISANSYGWYVVVPITGGKTYTVSKRNTGDIYLTTTSTFPTYGVPQVDSWRGSNNVNQLSISTSSNANYLFIGLLAAGSPTQQQKDNAISELMVNEGSSALSYCVYGSASSKLDDTNKAINNIDNTLNNTNVDNSSQLAKHYFEGFQVDTHGLSGIVSAPLRLFSSLLGANCQPLTFQLPFVHNEVSIQCMSNIYTTYFNVFLTIYRVITDGIIGYWVCIKIFKKVKDFLDPTNDRIEVFDL